MGDINQAGESAKDKAVELREKAIDAAKAKADETNKTRTGKGLRIRVGSTRGKNPQVISF